MVKGRFSIGTRYNFSHSSPSREDDSSMAELFDVSSDEPGEDEEGDARPWSSSASWDASAADSDFFVPIFSPHFRFTSSDQEVPSDSEYESSYEESSLPVDDACPDCADHLAFGNLDGAEDMGSDYLRLGLGLGSVDFGKDEMESDLEEAQLGGNWGARFGEDEGLRAVGFGSETESDLDEQDEGISRERIVDFGMEIGRDELRSDLEEAHLPGNWGCGFEHGEGLRIVDLGSEIESDLDEGNLSERLVDFGMEFGNEDQGSDLEEEHLGGIWGSAFSRDEPCTSRKAEGLRIVGFGSDTESDLDEQSEEIPLERTPAFDCSPETLLNDLYNVGLNQDFEWEEVEESAADSEDLEIDEDDEEERPRLDWEFLLAMNSLNSSLLVDYDGFEEQHADIGYSSENEILFEQFVGQESFIKGSPPTAIQVIEDLPSVVLTQSTVCAVCKDEISLEENPKQLPCSHCYHGECILPWLRIRNTCPVCRHELPTDDPDYELQRVARAGTGTIALYRLEVFD